MLNVEKVNLKFYLNEIDCLLEFNVDFKEGESVFRELVELTKKLKAAGAVSFRPTNGYKNSNYKKDGTK